MNDPRLRRHHLGFLQPVKFPSPDELRDYYADRYFQEERANYRESYPEAEIEYFNIKIAQRASLVDKLRKVNNPGTMLDVGCGEGFALAWFREHGWKVEGIDYSVAGLETMNPDLLPCVEAGDLFAILGERIKADKNYDLVWLNNVLEHVADPVGLLKSLRRLMSTGGVLVVTVPNDGSEFQEQLLRRGDIPDRFWIALPDHLAYFTYKSLERTAHATGWDCKDIIADFPIDLFLLHQGSNYVKDASKGGGRMQPVFAWN